ncbi:MAG: M81 family metallopeptidase [Rhodospirillales bacterium]|nr:M81 family metallopeptidase [Rhodospirillales bacterium]
MRIAVLHFSHETVTFLANDTTLEDFVYPGSPCAGEALLAMDPKGYIGGFVQVAREQADVELVGIESPGFPKTGTGSGWVTEEAFEHFVGRMVAELRAQGPFDGVYLAVHGAMGARGVARPEAELAARVRAAVGPKARIAGTFDPHGNEDDAFFRHADLAFTVKYFPHYDSHLQGERAARMLIRAIRGDFKPAHATVKVPIISPTVLQWTGAAPWSDLVQRALTWEARAVDTYVNVFFGFPWSDVPDVGMTIQVTTNGDAELARRVADDMAQWAWRKREALLGTTRVLTIAEGVAAARDAAKPAILADHSDRSGYATWLLREIIDRGLGKTLVATVADGPLVARLLAAGIAVGDRFDEMVGGTVDPSAGAPVRVTGTVAALPGGVRRGNAQTWIMVAFGDGNVVAISPYLVQIIEPDDLRAYGLEPNDFEVIAIKSRVHFRRGFDDSGFARSIFLVEPPESFLGTVRLDGLPYRNVDLKAFYPYGSPAFPPAPPGPARG